MLPELSKSVREAIKHQTEHDHKMFKLLWEHQLKRQAEQMDAWIKFMNRNYPQQKRYRI